MADADAETQVPQLTADVDSGHSFEGPEKLLEVWFAPSAASLPAGANKKGLKAVGASAWEAMLDLVHCRVLSVMESEHVDAYLLSESSMFVFAHKLILKTCGTTTLLLGLRRLLRVAAADAGFPCAPAEGEGEHHEPAAAAAPYRVFYSRKNFLHPDRQRGPHRSWKQEVDFLDRMFGRGSAYMVGKMNADHWYLYMTAPDAGSPGTDGAHGAHDETLELLMTDLCVERADQFHAAHAARASASAGPEHAPATQTTQGHALGTVVSDACGLSALYPTCTYPDARIDAYLFSPCGFSANGVVPAAEAAADPDAADHYFTVHVTPEPHCSFASFETNVPAARRPTVDVVEHVVEIFRPGRFIMTLFEAKFARDATASRTRPVLVQGYRREDRIVYEFDDYDLVFAYYERDDWVGDGVARVGRDIYGSPHLT